MLPEGCFGVDDGLEEIFSREENNNQPKEEKRKKKEERKITAPC